MADGGRIESLQNADRLEAALLASPQVRQILQRWDEIDLPQCWLVAGAVVQTYWNKVYQCPIDWGIDDVDIVYFDSSDLSAETEAANQRRVEALFVDFGSRFDVKNEARVHLWYEQKFGIRIPPYKSVAAAIACFPTTVGSIGVRMKRGTFEVIAPYGLDDLFELTVRPNKRQVTKSVYDAKVARWRRYWPNLAIVEWQGG